MRRSRRWIELRSYGPELARRGLPGAALPCGGVPGGRVRSGRVRSGRAPGGRVFGGRVFSGSFLAARFARASSFLIASSVALAGSWAPPASAQDPQQKAAAEALFDEGIALRRQGQFEAACKKFEQSEEIDTGVGVLLYLGECYERIGRLASAWALFREAHSRAKETGQEERARLAEDNARRLSASLSRMVLVVPQAARVPGLELLLNGRVISAALYGVPFPVDAGRHELTARAPGHQTWSELVEVKSSADVRNVQIPSLTQTEEPVAAASPAAPGGPGYTPPQGAVMTGVAEPSSAPRPELIPVYLLGGVGVAALGAGVIFGLHASSKDDEARPYCPSGCYTRDAADDNEAARTAALVANISYAVGAAALLTSAYLFFTASSSSESTAQQAPPLLLGGNLNQGGGFVSVSGNF